MTIIQRHGKGEPRNLADYQFGWSEGDGNNYLGELYIKDGKNGIHPVTDEVEKRLTNQIEFVKGDILKKISKGKLSPFESRQLFLNYIADEKSEIEENDQFLVKHDSMPNVKNGDDVVLYIAFKMDSGKFDPDNGDLEPFNKELYIRPITSLDLTYHDPYSKDNDRLNLTADTDEARDALEAASNELFGIVVGTTDEKDNTIDISLSNKTHALLKGLDDLGLVGTGVSGNIFDKGFVTGIESLNVVPVETGTEGLIEGRTLRLTISGQAKENGVWSPYSQKVDIDLKDLVIDEGSW